MFGWNFEFAKEDGNLWTVLTKHISMLCNNHPMIASPEARVKRSLENRPRARDFGVYCVETRRGRLKTEEKKK